MRTGEGAPRARGRRRAIALVTVAAIAATTLATRAPLFAPRPAQASIEIAAPVEAVWQYVGNSDKAREWSVYFDHITPLPGTARDGTPGSVRRCFRRADRTGVRWDEEIVAVEPLRRREIRVFDMVGTRVQWAVSGEEMRVVQRYEPLDVSRTRLSFSTQPRRAVDAVRALLFVALRPETERVFNLNLENIRLVIEAGSATARLHPWEPQHVID